MVLLDAAQREALRLARVVASVSPRSLWRLSFEQLYIERPELDVRRRCRRASCTWPGSTCRPTPPARAAAPTGSSPSAKCVVEGGTVRWTDERAARQPLLLTDVRFVARNGGRRHAMRLDATPPAGWGERFTLRGEFRQPLLSVRSGNWKSWDGQLVCRAAARSTSAAWAATSTLDARIREGSGAPAAVGRRRATARSPAARPTWRWRASTPRSATGLEPLVLRAVTGRLAGRRRDGTLEFSTAELQFETADGLRWPGGNLSFQHAAPRAARPSAARLRADRLDLGALALIADRLPLGDADAPALLTAYAPRGAGRAHRRELAGTAATRRTVPGARAGPAGCSVAAQPRRHPLRRAGTPRERRDARPVGSPGCAARRSSSTPPRPAAAPRSRSRRARSTFPASSRSR